MSDGGAGDGITQEQFEELKAQLDAANDKVAEFRTNNIDLMKKLKGFDGIDPEKHKQLLTRLDELEQKQTADKAGVTEEQLKELRADVERGMVERYSKMSAEDLAAKLPGVAEIVNDNRSLRLDSKVKAEMAKAGVRSERIDALFRLSADEFDLTADGQPMVRNHPDLDVSKFVSENLKQDYPELYVGSGAGGGGASKSAAGGSGSKKIQAGDRDAFSNNLEKIAKGEIEVEMSA